MLKVRLQNGNLMYFIYYTSQSINTIRHIHFKQYNPNNIYNKNQASQNNKLHILYKTKYIIQKILYTSNTINYKYTYNKYYIQ